MFSKLLKKGKKLAGLGKEAVEARREKDRGVEAAEALYSELRELDLFGGHKKLTLKQADTILRKIHDVLPIIIRVLRFFK